MLQLLRRLGIPDLGTKKNPDLNFGYSLDTGCISKATVPHSMLLEHECPRYPGTDLIKLKDPYVNT